MSQVAAQPQPKHQEPRTKHPYPWYAPRFWHSMRIGDWFRLLARNRFRVSPTRIGLSCTVSGASVFNSVAGACQSLLYGRKIARTEIDKPPIFIVGHWRSGTTYLHELMCRDPRYAYPTTFDCFAPNHYLVTSWILPKVLWILLPSKRPMDNMSAGFDHPQEDEFALGAMGAPTPYHRMAFPNEPPCHMEMLDMQGVDSKDLHRWKEVIVRFVKSQTLQKGKQLILKSPPHTGRIQILSELFPGARFIHIARHPESIFASTHRLWPQLDFVQGLQVPRNEQLTEYVFAAFERMYRGYEAQRESIDSDHLYETRYEDLVQDPIGELQRIYTRLDLGDFDTVKTNLEAYLGDTKDYKTNRHPELPPEIRQQIRDRWSGYIQRYGYQLGDPAV